MKHLGPIVIAAMSLLLAGCAGGLPGGETGSAAPAVVAEGAQQSGADGQTVVQVPQYDIKAVSVVAPRTLRVSEANLIKPVADIVWRGDPKGDRYTQVEAIIADAAGQATARMGKGRAALLDLEVTRFHALTEKARYVLPFGGEFEIGLIVTLRDAKTGALIDGPREIARDVAASTGKHAIEEEAKGYTEKKAVTEAAFQLLRDELVRPVTVGAEAQPEKPVVR
jgi:hypothetical protein